MPIKLQVVVSAVIIHKGKILIQQRQKVDSVYGKWETPGGKVEKDETLEGACFRECVEELMGAEINIGRILTAEVNHINSDNVLIFYVATFDKPSPPKGLIGETIKLIDQDDAYKYDILRGSLEAIEHITRKDIEMSFPLRKPRQR